MGMESLNFSKLLVAAWMLIVLLNYYCIQIIPKFSNLTANELFYIVSEGSGNLGTGWFWLSISYEIVDKML